MPEGSAAVIGAGGFLGSALVERLGRVGVCVAGYKRLDPFVTERGRVTEGLATASSVFWLASSIRPSTAGNRLSDADADRNAFHQLLEILGSRPDPPRVIVVSSGGTVYDTASRPPHTENSPVGPANEYGAAMLEIERLVREWGDTSVVLRVGNAYGPGQHARKGQGVIAYWLSAIAAGDPIHIVGSDQVARDYVYVEDVVEALAAVHAASDPPRVVNIGSGHPTTLAELVQRIGGVVAPTAVYIRRVPARQFDAPSTWLDITLATETLGWQPRTPLVVGLTETWQWLISRARGR